MVRRAKRRSGSIAPPPPAVTALPMKEDPTIDEAESEHSKPVHEFSQDGESLKSECHDGESLGTKRPREDSNPEAVGSEYLRQKAVLQEHHRGVSGVGTRATAARAVTQCHTYQAQAELRSQHHSHVKRQLRFEGEAMRTYREQLGGEEEAGGCGAQVVDSSFEPSGVPFQRTEGEEGGEGLDEMAASGEANNNVSGGGGGGDDDDATGGDEGVVAGQDVDKKFEELTRAVQVVVGKQSRDEVEQRFARRFCTELTTGVCLWNDVSPILYGRVLQYIQFYCAKMLLARKVDKPQFPPEECQSSHDGRCGGERQHEIVAKPLTSVGEEANHGAAESSDNDTVIESEHELDPLNEIQMNDDEGSDIDHEEDEEEDMEDFIDDDDDEEQIDDDDEEVEEGHADEEEGHADEEIVENGEEQGDNKSGDDDKRRGEPHNEEGKVPEGTRTEEISVSHAPVSSDKVVQPSPWNEAPWDDMYTDEAPLQEDPPDQGQQPSPVAARIVSDASMVACEEAQALDSTLPTPSMEARSVEERPKRVLLFAPEGIPAVDIAHHTISSVKRRRPSSWICYPRIQRMASALLDAIFETFDTVAARSLHSTMSASEWDDWSAQRKLELTYAVNKMFLVFNNTDLRLLDVTRKVTRIIEGLGFVDQGISLVWHDVCLMRAAETQCYSYHPRLFSTMSTLNANQNPFALIAVRNLELSDKRIGKIPSISRRHPHPEVNTAVLLCEPKKKKGTIDEFRTLPHPKKAGIHAVEDFLVGEELLYRQCIQLKDHLHKVGSLKGLPIHLNSLIYALVDYDIEDFAKLQSSKKQFVVNIPQSLMRRISDGLATRLANLEASREATRLAVGTIGFYCQGVIWRDQVLAAAQNYGAQSHYYLGLSEWELTQQQSLLPNFFADSSYGPQLETALKHFLHPETDPIWLPVFEVLIPMLQGRWRRDEVKNFSDEEEPGRTQRTRRQWWGPIGETTEYLAPSWIIFALQSVVIVGELLQSSWLNTCCDPLEFLIKFAESGKWKSDDTAAQYLASAEKTTNLATARLAALGMAINSLRIRLTVMSQEKSIAFLEQFVEIQKNAPSYAKGCSYPCYQLMDADKSVATTLIGKVIVSTQSVGHHIPPALVVADAHRGSESDIRTFFGPLKVPQTF